MWAFLEGVGNEGSAIGGIIALITFVAAPFLWFWKRNKVPKVEITNPPPSLPPTPPNTIQMDVAAFTEMQRQLRDEARAELAAAHGEERKRLEDKIDALNARLRDPDEALAQQQAIITGLEEQLARRSNEIGGDDVASARAALEAGDFTKARALFETLAARTAPEVAANADAEFALGQIAEAEIRWHDAYSHYKRAIALSDSLRHLKALARMTWHLHLTAEGIPLHQRLCDAAKAEFGSESAEYAAELNNFASIMQECGRYDEAERLKRRALEIARATIGEAHPNYAIGLNNLASAVQAQGRYAEAEELYRQALEIDRTTIGEAHPSYATRLNNLAHVVWAQGRYAEAAGLFRQALEIDRATIGEAHPDYAIDLNNLAAVVEALGRYAEAEGLYQQALEIDRATIGEAHPSYAIRLNNLAGVVRAQGRHAEAEGLFRQALGIARKTLGDRHPDTQTFARNLQRLITIHLPGSPHRAEVEAVLAAAQTGATSDT